MQKKHRLELYAQNLEAASPVRKLSQGYAFLTEKGGRAIHSAADVAPGSIIDAHMLDGRIRAEVKEVLGEQARAETRLAGR